jgi:hypothetical protein
MIEMENTIPTEPARWRRSQIAETFASVRVSAPSYHFAENIGFVPIVEPEFKHNSARRSSPLPTGEDLR